MQCKYCGAKLSENAKFCGVCGNKVERETVKPKHNDPIPDKVHNTGNEKYRWKKGIIPVIVLLCVIVAGAGFFYYKSKGGSASTAGDKGIEKAKMILQKYTKIRKMEHKILLVNIMTDIFITEKETICTGKKRKVQME